MSIREIARWYGVDDRAVRKKAPIAGWTRTEGPKHIEYEAEVRVPVARMIDVSGLADRSRDLMSRMVDELDATTTLHGELEDMICAEESDPARRKALLRSLSLGERAVTLKNLSTALKTLNEAAAPDGKKAQRQDRADAASSAGKFAVPAAPRLIVNNK